MPMAVFSCGCVSSPQESTDVCVTRRCPTRELPDLYYQSLKVGGELGLHHYLNRPIGLPQHSNDVVKEKESWSVKQPHNFPLLATPWEHLLLN